MRPDPKAPLRALDRALIALVEERARLVVDLALAPAEARAAQDDLLRRHRGRLGRAALTELLDMVERLTAPADREEAR